jgi:hypothetical protein
MLRRPGWAEREAFNRAHPVIVVRRDESRIPKTDHDLFLALASIWRLEEVRSKELLTRFYTFRFTSLSCWKTSSWHDGRSASPVQQ